MATNSVNKVILVGNLGDDITLNQTSGGTHVASFSVATNEKWRDKQTGQEQKSTEWHRVVVWGKLAEITATYLKKGSKVYVEGKMKTRKWQDNGGIDRYSSEIVADDVKFLD